MLHTPVSQRQPQQEWQILTVILGRLVHADSKRCGAGSWEVLRIEFVPPLVLNILWVQRNKMEPLPSGHF